MSEKFVLKNNKGYFILLNENGGYVTSKEKYTTFTKEEVKNLFNKNKEKFQSMAFCITKEKNIFKKSVTDNSNKSKSNKNRYTIRNQNNEFIVVNEGGSFEISKESYTAFNTQDEALAYYRANKEYLKANIFNIVVEKTAKKIIESFKNGVVIHSRKSFSSEKRKEIYRNSEGKCDLCGDFIDFENFTIDHIVPLAKGGTNDSSNLQCTCERCNKIKDDILPDEFIETLTKIIEHDLLKNKKSSTANRLFKTIMKNKLSFK